LIVINEKVDPVPPGLLTASDIVKADPVLRLAVINRVKLWNVIVSHAWKNHPIQILVISLLSIQSSASFGDEKSRRRTPLREIRLRLCVDMGKIVSGALLLWGGGEPHPRTT
jgi:hypothetical protein